MYKNSLLSFKVNPTLAANIFLQTTKRKFLIAYFLPTACSVHASTEIRDETDILVSIFLSFFVNRIQPRHRVVVLIVDNGRACV